MFRTMSLRKILAAATVAWYVIQFFWETTHLADDFLIAGYSLLVPKLCLYQIYQLLILDTCAIKQPSSTYVALISVYFFCQLTDVSLHGQSTLFQIFDMGKHQSVISVGALHYLRNPSQFYSMARKIEFAFNLSQSGSQRCLVHG